MTTIYKEKSARTLDTPHKNERIEKMKKIHRVVDLTSVIHRSIQRHDQAKVKLLSHIFDDEFRDFQHLLLFWMGLFEIYWGEFRFLIFPEFDLLPPLLGEISWADPCPSSASHALNMTQAFAAP